VVRPEQLPKVKDQSEYTDRQESPHPHQCVTLSFENREWIMVPDLGNDCVHFYRVYEDKLLEDTILMLSELSGPRHID